MTSTERVEVKNNVGRDKLSRRKRWLVIMTHKSGFADTTIVLVVLDQSLEEKLQ
ncbi:hypothetical protein [Amphritea sp. HPY]|uniref:hypothetical protein n=1 Tax=Amphritea sp. HPY TaxID=3421652 RepID=UPI003D7E53B0